MRQATVQCCWRRVLGGAAVALMVVAFGHTETQAQQHKPNILVMTLPQARHVQWDAPLPLPRSIIWIPDSTTFCGVSITSSSTFGNLG